MIGIELCMAASKYMHQRLKFVDSTTTTSLFGMLFDVINQNSRVAHTVIIVDMGLCS